MERIRQEARASKTHRLGSSLEQEEQDGGSFSDHLDVCPPPPATVFVTIKKSSIKTHRERRASGSNEDVEEREDDEDSVPKESDAGEGERGEGEKEKKLPAASVASLFSSFPQSSRDGPSSVNPQGEEDSKMALDLYTCQLDEGEDLLSVTQTEEDDEDEGAGAGGGELEVKSSLSSSSSVPKVKETHQGCALRVSRCKTGSDGKPLKEKKTSSRSKQGGCRSEGSLACCCLSPDLICGVPEAFSPYIREFRASECGISIISPDFYFLQRGENKDENTQERRGDRERDGAEAETGRRARDSGDHKPTKVVTEQAEKEIDLNQEERRGEVASQEGDEEIRRNRAGSSVCQGADQGHVEKRTESKEEEHETDEDAGVKPGHFDRAEGVSLERSYSLLRKEITRGFFSFLPVLEVLDLRWNNLSSLPVSIAHLASLHTLLLDGNALTSLPVVILLLPRLKILSVSSNFLTVFPSLPLPETSCDVEGGGEVEPEQDVLSQRHAAPPFLPRRGGRDLHAAVGGGEEQWTSRRKRRKRRRRREGGGHRCSRGIVSQHG